MHSPVFIPIESTGFRNDSACLPATVHPAAAVLFLDAHRPGQVLVGVRRAETNRRHPGVVSIPTIRIPTSWIAPFEIAPAHEKHHLKSPRCTFGLDKSTESTEGAIVELTLAKKILSGDDLNGRVFGSCAARLLMTDLVDDPSGRDGTIELTRMLTIVAVCEGGADLLTGSTGSYEDLRWVPADELATAWRSKDGRALFPDRVSTEVCVRGLCLKSAVEMILSDDPAHLLRLPD